MNRLEWLKNLITRNWHIKLLSLFVAVVSYYAIMSTLSFEVVYDVPVTVEVEQGMAVLEQDTQVLHITCRGAQNDHNRLDQKQLRALLHARGTERTGPQPVPVDARNIEGLRGSGLRVVSIRPGTVMVSFDRETRKEARVLEPPTIGTPLIGRVQISYEPKTVVLTGPRRRLEGRDTVRTEAVDVDGRVESFTRRVRVLPPAGAHLTSIEPAEINVKIEIVTESVEKIWENVPVVAVKMPGTSQRIHIEPATVTLHVQGRSEVIDSLSRDVLRVFVDCIGLDTSASYDLPLDVHWPPGLEITARTKPGSAKVSFSMPAPP